MDSQELEELENAEDASSLETPNESLPLDMELEPPKKALSAIASKKLVQQIFKMKMITIIAAVSLGGLLILFFLGGYETSNNHQRAYVEPKCTEVTITYDPYDESIPSSTEKMSLEEYVSSATYEYAKNFKDKPTGTFNVYYSLAVSLRTEALSQDCKVTYRDKKLSKTNARDTIIEDALELSKGLVIGNKNNEPLPVKVSDFCFDTFSNDTLKYQIFQGNHLDIPQQFIHDNLSNEIYRDCPCNQPTGSYDDEYSKCWVTWEVADPRPDDPENTLLMSSYLHYDDEVGYSVMGAYYLFLNYGKNYNEILKFFFGDYEWMTIIDPYKVPDEDKTIADSKTNCSQFSLTTTTLSKSEFVSKVEAHSNSDEAWPLFQQNAGKIYDLAVSNNVNPEIIIVRAILEGFSPGGRKHNYFGITCYNKQPEKCSSFATFDEGILGFIQVIQRYDSFSSFAQRYAYLGDAWYNPGGSGDGGCYYASYIFPDGMDEYVQVACSSAYKNCSNSQCLPTRDKDKEAYALFQAQKMFDKRKEVFGISSNTCTNDTLNVGNCVLYNQANPIWFNVQLGTGKSNIGNAGCALTSMAIAMTCTGMIDDVSHFSPVVLNQRLIANGGFSGSLIYWDNPAMREFVPTFKLAERFDGIKNKSREYKINIFKKGLQSNTVGILFISNSVITSHFVVLKSINEEAGTVEVLDPGGGFLYTYSVDDMAGFKYYTY